MSAPAQTVRRSNIQDVFNLSTDAAVEMLRRILAERAPGHRKAVEVIRAELIRRFALTRGWQVSQTTFDIARLSPLKVPRQWIDCDAMDHAVHFRLGGQPVAVVAQPYRSEKAVFAADALARHLGLVAELGGAPEWYAPGEAMPIVFRRPERRERPQLIAPGLLT